MGGGGNVVLRGVGLSSGTVKSQASNSKKAIHCRASPTRRVFLYTVGLVGLTHDLQRRELMTSAGESGGA